MTLRLAGLSSASGNVLDYDTDRDAGDSKTVTFAGAEAITVSVSIGTTITGTYGTLTINPDGTWSYALNNSDPDTQALAVGDRVKDLFTYTMSDGLASSSSTLTIFIDGSNDGPVITMGGVEGAVTEGNLGATLSESGSIAFEDIDANDLVSVRHTLASAV